MVGDPLELGVDDPDQPPASARDLDLGDPLDRLAVGDRMGHRRHALAPLGQEHAVVEVHALEADLDAAVLVEHAGAQVGDVLAGRLDQVLDRLEDARAHRPVGDGEHAFALRRGRAAASSVGFDRSRSAARSRPRAGRAWVEREDERVEAGMAHRYEAEEVVDLPLVPGGRRASAAVSDG